MYQQHSIDKIHFFSNSIDKKLINSKKIHHAIKKFIRFMVEAAKGIEKIKSDQQLMVLFNHLVESEGSIEKAKCFALIEKLEFAIDHFEFKTIANSSALEQLKYDITSLYETVLIEVDISNDIPIRFEECLRRKFEGLINEHSKLNLSC